MFGLERLDRGVQFGMVSRDHDGVAGGFRLCRRARRTLAFSSDRRGMDRGDQRGGEQDSGKDGNKSCFHDAGNSMRNKADSKPGPSPERTLYVMKE